jgi:hypothetical protein
VLGTSTTSWAEVDAGAAGACAVCNDAGTRGAGEAGAGAWGDAAADAAGDFAGGTEARLESLRSRMRASMVAASVSSPRFVYMLRKSVMQKAVDMLDGGELPLLVHWCWKPTLGSHSLGVNRKRGVRVRAVGDIRQVGGIPVVLAVAGAVH